MGPSVSFSRSELCPKSLLLFDVLARGCADSVLKGGGMRSPIRSARGQSQSSMSISSPVLGVAGSVTGGMSRKCAESICRGIGIGDCDICDRLAKFVIGDCTSEMDLVPVNSAGGVNEGWVGLVCLSKGGVVGEGVPTLVDACDDGKVILLFNIIGDAGSEAVWW